MKDLREWLDALRGIGELVEVQAEVDPHLEITEIADRVMKAGGPALLFRNVKGSDMPVLINQFGSERRMAMGLGGSDLDEIAGRIAAIAQMQPPQGMMEKVKALGTLKDLASLGTKTVRSAPCQELVLRGDEVDLDRVPILTCWPGDGGPFVTLPLVFSNDPRTGTRNCGMYRVQKVDRTTCMMHWQIHKDGRQHLLDSQGRVPVAVVIGTDPAVTYSATAPLPPALDEMMFAGFLRGERVEMVKAVSQDIEVPADRLPGFLDFVHREVGIEPIWICPLKQRDPNATWPLYEFDAQTLYVNVGFWSTVPLPDGVNPDEGRVNRRIEEVVSELDGRKSLYSTAFYDRDTFWSMYGGNEYERLKKEYDPNDRLLGLYEKVVERR